MAKETLQKQWFQTPANFSQIDDPPAVSTCHTSQSLQIAIGDFVHVYPTDKQLGLYIARVEGLYEDVGGKRYLNVRWYYRPEDLQHQPPCHPIAQEVYHTDHLDCQLVDSIAGYCQVLFKTDSLKLIADVRAFSNLDRGTYICEFGYSAQNGVFSTLSQNDECPCDSFSSAKYVPGPSTRGTAAVAKELAEVLLDVEVNIPKEILPVSWVNFRQTWLHETANAKTIKEVANALLDLEDGVRILNDRRTLFPKDHAAWRKTVSGIHTYDLLAKYVKLFKLDVQHIIMNPVSNQSTRGIHHGHGLEKRKHFPDTISNKLQKIDGIHSSFQLDHCSNSGQQDTRTIVREAFPLSSNKEIVLESIYEINQEFLPPNTPTSLKFMRAVLVAEKTRFNVTVKFPSMASLQSYFDRAPEVMVNDRIRGTAKLSLVLDKVNKETCIGTKPELDDHYTMTPKIAQRVLIRRVSCTECLHQGHLWSFWVVEDLEEAKGRRFSGGNNTVIDHDLEDEAKGELGAAEALTQLIPGNAMIVTPEGNRAVNDKLFTEGPLRSQIRWGIRSLRRTSVGNRSGTGSSPNSCDTGTKDTNKDTRKTFSRKTLEFLDEQHQNIGQTIKGPNFSRTERSGRMQSRREEKFIDLVAVKGTGALRKSGNSKHIRSNTVLKLPKDMKGRWASERYKSAQLKLIEIMHKRGAVPGKPILRPALREEARKDIGDTGLLDHLLKHMTDTVVTNGERFRRRHNAEGAMEYWLEDASLMEIRKAAGIEDPLWIPPSGWKPGDALPGRGECANGCFSRGMTSAEADEMKKLKVMVEKATSDLQSLTSRVRRWRCREATPERTEGSEDDEHEIGTENGPALMQRNSESQKERRREVEEGKLACRILKEDKTQLLTDLSEVQRSVALMQEFIKCTMKELGFPLEENVKFSINEINSTGAIESRPVNVGPLGAHDATWPPLGPARNCLDKTSFSGDTNLRICRELESDHSKHGVDFASSVGGEPKRPHLLQSSPGHISVMQNGFKAYNPFASGCIVQPGMVIPQTGAHDVLTEDAFAPRTLSAAANTSSCLGHNAETSREDASARVIRSITGSDNESHFRPYFQHCINFFLPSTDTEVERENQITAYPGHRPDGNIVKWTTGLEGRDFQASSFHQAAFQSDSHGLIGAGLESAHARDGLTILSFAADNEAIAKTSQKRAKDQAVWQNHVSAIANLKYDSSLAVGPTRRHSPAVTEALKRRMLHQVETDQSPIISPVACSGCDTGNDSPSTSLSAVGAAPCDRRGSFELSASVAHGPFDETLAKSTSDSSSRSQHLKLTAVAKETPTVQMAKDLSINLSLTSHVPPGPGSSYPCNSLKSSRGGIAEPSSTLTLSRIPAANAVGIYGHIYSLHDSNSADQLESLQQVAEHSLEQSQAVSKTNLPKGVRSTMQKSFPEIVSEKCSTQSSTSKARCSTWLGLAPPTSSNSLS